MSVNPNGNPTSVIDVGSLNIDLAGIDLAGIDPGTGTDSGNGGTDAGTGTRRPRTKTGTDSRNTGAACGRTEADGNTVPNPVRRATSKGKPVPAEQLAAAISVACNSIANIRGEHWRQTRDGVMPLAEPLSEYIALVLPKKTAKQLAQMMLPIAIIIGASEVFGVTAAVELELLRERKNERQRKSQRNHVKDERQAPSVDASPTPVPERPPRQAVDASARNGYYPFDPSAIGG